MKISVLTPVGRELSTDHQRCVDVLRERYPSVAVLREYGITCVDQARALLFERGMASGAEVLFWIDADIIFDPDDLLRVAERCVSGDYDVLAVAYARRVPGGGLNVELDSPREPVQFFRPGFARAKSVGFGFTAMRAACATTLAKVCPRAKLGVLRQGKPGLVDVSTIFAARVVDGLWLPDDESFCGYVTAAEFRIGVDLEPRIWHQGTYHYGLEDSAMTVKRVGTLNIDFVDPPTVTS
jgi:hypothetical protein